MDIQIFNSPQFGNIRTAGTAEQPLFCLVDVCRAIGIANARNVKERLDEDDVRLVDTIDKLGRTQKVSYVTESGLYDVIIRSDSVNAKSFRKWVTSEVLPSIRRSGGYVTARRDDTPEEIMARALMVAQDTLARREERLRMLEVDNEAKQREIEAARPAVTFTSAVSGAESSCLVGELAKVIAQNGVEIGEKRLFQWLRDNGYLGRHGERYNVPNQKYIEQGLFTVKKGVRSGSGGVLHTTLTPKITGKGQVYFVNKFLNSVVL